MERVMKDSGVEWIGTIPEEWKLERLQWHIKEIIARNDPVITENILSLTKDKGVIPYVDKGNQGNKSKEDLSGYKIAYKDTLVVNSMNVLIGSVDISAYEGCVSPVYYVFKNTENTDIRFINYIFKTEAFQKQLRRYANGILEIRLRVSAENILKQSIALPEIAQQKKIVSFLDARCAEIDNITSKTQNSIEEYKRYKQAIITETIIKGINSDVIMKQSGIDYIGNIPSHWKIRRLRFLGYCQNGISKGGEAFGSGYPFVSYGDVYRNFSLPESIDGLIESTESDREIYSVKRGDVFFTRTSETIEEVGFTSACLKTIDKATFAGFVIRFRPFDESMLLPEYSKYYFRSEMHRRFFVKEMNLVTRASLSQELLKKLPVILPPLEEQKQIAKHLDEKIAEIDLLIEKKEAFIADMENYKKSLIYEYVTGKRM